MVQFKKNVLSQFNILGFLIYLYCEFTSKMLNLLRCQTHGVERKEYVHTVFQLILFFKRQIINK